MHNIEPKQPCRMKLHFLLLALAMSAGASAHATVWAFTNRADSTWATPLNWSPSGGPVIGVTNFPGRANVNARLIYDSPLTTGLGTLSTAAPEYGRGLVIANGNNATGALEVVNGHIVVFQAVVTEPVLVGAAGGPTQGPNEARLTLNGGHLTVVATNFGMLAINFRGTNTTTAVLDVQNGSVLTVDRISFGGITAGPSQIGAGASGTMNLNTGGTVVVRNIRNVDPADMRATNNFNGGTLTIKAPEEGGSPLLGPGLVNNVLAGGLLVDSAGQTGRIHSPLLNGTGGLDGGLTKNGEGAVNITIGGSTYTGPTVVNAGTLGVTLPMASSSLTLAPGTRLSVTVSNSSWSPATMTLQDNVLDFALGQVTGPLPPAILTVGTLNASGNTVVNITSGVNIPTDSPVVLMDYGGNKVGGGTFTLGTLAPGMLATFEDDGTRLLLRVTRSVQALTWSAGTGDWGVGTGLLNWNSGTAEYLEYPDGSGDLVRFDDTAGVWFGLVTIVTDVHPLDIMVDNSTTAYTFTGPGRITGATGLTKRGTGLLTLTSAHTYDGVTRVSGGGTLQVTAAGALGSTVGRTEVSGGSTLMIGDGFGTGVRISGETVYIRGAGVGGARGALRGAADAGPNVWDGPVVLGEDLSRIGTEDGGSLEVAGPIVEEGTNNWVVILRPGAFGTLTISGTGHRYGPTRTYGNADGSGVIRLGAHQALSTNELQHGPGPVDLNGFDLTIGGLSDNAGVGTMVNNGAGPSVLTIDTRTNNFAAACALMDGASSLGLIKLGAGRQTLNGVNTHTGPTLVQEGVLRINGQITASPVIVSSGGELQGTGTIHSTVTVGNGGRLAPGASIGTLTVNQLLTLEPGSTSIFELTATTNDLVVAPGDVVYGGQLVVTNIGAAPLRVGQVFKLFLGFSNGDFDNSASVQIGGGGTATFDPLTGDLTITSVPPPASLHVVRAAGTLQLSWTNVNGIYRLQAQTNGLDSNKWFDYPGGATSPVTVPIDLSNGSVFFRLVAP
jgi:autotransporter-associated beta strand protein